MIHFIDDNVDVKWERVTKRTIEFGEMRDLRFTRIIPFKVKCSFLKVLIFDEFLNAGDHDIHQL